MENESERHTGNTCAFERICQPIQRINDPIQ